MEAFKVIDPGTLTTFQDLGRPGFRKYGIPLSGAMDAIALKAANLFVGNEESKVGLEVTFKGLKMAVLAPIFVAVTGGDMGFSINGEDYPPWRTFFLVPGDVIFFSNRKSGMRAYLSVRGGFLAPTFLGSGSVFQRGCMGTPLFRGQILEVETVDQVGCQEVRVPEDYLPQMSDQVSVRVIMGPQEERFAEEGIEHFLGSVYRVKSQSDRMAYRLEGDRVTLRGKADLISEPLLPGSIQVPSDELPIILMVDAQVTGGYVKIANVISADISILSQVMPGGQIRFKAVDLEEAYQALEQRELLLLWLRSQQGSIRPKRF